MPRYFCSLLRSPLEERANSLDTGLERSHSIFSPRDSGDNATSVVARLIIGGQSANIPSQVSEGLLRYFLPRFALSDQSIQFRTQSAKFRTEPRNVA